MPDLEKLMNGSILKISEEIKRKNISPLEITKKTLEQIQKKDKNINSFITILNESALIEARKAERDILSGNIKGPLHGIPIGIKDNIFTRNIITTMGSQVYSDHIPSINATVIEKLKSAGAIIIGKLNTHELAYGGTGDKSFFGPVKNPYNITHITGGSSSGSAAAVGSSLCYGAIGTDTGGSIRIPASFCGVVGMKPTFGRVSKYGVYPLCWSMDHVGPITKTISDNAILMNIIAGFDKKDPYSVKKEKEDFSRFIKQDVSNAVIGIPSSYYFGNIDKVVLSKVTEAIQIFRNLGAKIQIVDIPSIEKISYARKIIFKSEAYAANKKIVEKHGDLLDEEVKEKLLSGKNVKGHEYAHANMIKNIAIQEFNNIFNNVDIILTPTVPTLPVKLGSRKITLNNIPENINNIIGNFTGPTNLNGLPSLSLPCGFSNFGLPIGLQLIGRPFSESVLYKFGYVFEQTTDA